MAEPIEFECQDCGMHIYSYGAPGIPDPLLCASCGFLREFYPDPVEREAVRARMDPFSQREKP